MINTNLERAKMFASEADKMLSENPERAAVLYLNAAEIYLELSQTTNPYQENEFLTIAAKLYDKSQQVQNTKIKTENQKIKNTKLKKPITRFKDIAGLQKLKMQIRLKIIEPFKHPEIFKKFGKRVGGGILMYGPPGCGKSLIAEATAGEADCNFYHVKASDLKSKYVGETEQNIAALFEEARNNQPCIIFFDEFEALGGNRSNTDKYTAQAVSQILTEMDGVGAKEQKILLLAATNEPWNIDPALQREGRFGTSIFVPPPDSESRKILFEMNLKNKPVKDINFEFLGNITPGLSGADIVNVCEESADLVLSEFIETKNFREIDMKDIVKIAKSKRSSLKFWLSQTLEHLKRTNSTEYFRDLAELGNVIG